jgi:hypothetical protein
MQNREAYFEAVGELLNAGQTEADAHSAVRTKYPQLFNRLAQEAIARRGRPGHRCRQEATQASAPAPKPTSRELVNLAVAGNPVDQAAVVNACRSINRHPNTFLGEVRRERDRIEAAKIENSKPIEPVREPIAQRRQPARKPANQPATNYFGADYIDPNEHRFNLAVAEAAKCSRTYSDGEIIAAGFDVANFRSALRDAVHDKVMHRSYAVGSVVCDCSSGVCVCR